MKKVLFSLLALFAVLSANAQKVTLDLSEDGWGFPSDYVNTQAEYTNGDYTITMISGTDGSGWKKQGSGILFGKNGAAVQLPAFSFPVSKIVVNGQSGASGKVTFNVFVGDDAVSTVATGATSSQTFEIDGAYQAAGKVYTIKNTNSNNNQITTIEIYEASEDDIPKPSFSVKAGTYYDPVSVELTTVTEGATIKYSTDGENYSDYTEAINISVTTTLYAKTVKGDAESDVASATYVIAETYASLTDLAQVTPANQPVVVTVENEPIKSIYVTSKGYRNGIYLAAGERDIEIFCYDVPETWEAGGKVTGTVKGIYKDFNGTWEVCPDSWDCLTFKPIVFANDFEEDGLGDWTTTVPESPYTGGFAVVTYAAEAALKVANVGENTLGGVNALRSKTGATNAVKGNSDNWLVSPAVTIKEDASILAFRLAANCSYSPTKEEVEKMKMDVVVISGTDSTVVASVAPENYFTWKQYAIDLSSYVGKQVNVAFHDYGTAGSGAIADMKYLDNIELTGEDLCDYAIEEVTPLHGQAEYTAPYTIRVTNYGLSKGEFNAVYSIGDAAVSETVTSDIASGQSVEYTFQTNPQFEAGTTVAFNASVAVEGDAIEANNALAEKTLTACAIQTIPYAVCNAMDEEGEITDDAVETEFAAVTSSSKSKWAYDAVKYNAWIFSQTKADDKYVGAGYLYTTKAFTLPEGEVTLKTIGTATLTDMKYEVYIGKYGAEGMADYATKVGESEIMRDVTTTGGGIDTTTVVLNIPEAGDYVVAIRPINHLANAQMTLIGYSLEVPEVELAATFDPADGTEIASFGAGDLITVTFNKPEVVGYTEWKLVDNNPKTPEDAIIRTGMMKKNDDGSWYGKFYYETELLQGHTYTVTVYPYATEADMQAEADHNTYSNALGQFTATYTGTTEAYEYSSVSLVSLSPAEHTVLNVNDNVITAVFSDVVTLTAERNGGQSGDNTPCEVASEDGKTWTITIPESVMTSTSGALNINVYVKDAEGKVVEGNMGEDENSYFVWNYATYAGSPEFTITPGSGVVEQIDKIRVSYAGGINLSWQCADQVKIYKGDNVVYTVAEEDFSYDWDDITWLDITLPTPITEAGTYKVVFPAVFFSLGEEFDGYMNKEQTVEYTIEGTPEPEPATLVVTPEEGTVELLKEFTFTTSDGSMIAPSSIEDGDIVIFDTFNNVVATFTQDQLTAGVVVDEETYMPTSVVVNLKEAITADGVYTVVIPEGAFYLGEDMNPSEEMYLTYTIGEPKRFYVDPAEGVVESLSEVVMTWDTIVSVGPGKVTVKKDGEEVSQIDFFYTMDDPWNVVRLAYEATEPGTYTFEIPEGSLLLGEMGDEACEAITLTYTIEGPAEPDFVITVNTDERTITITPTDENAIYMLMGGYASDYNDEVAQALANEEAEYIPSADDLAEYASYGYYLQGTVLEDSPLGVLGIEDDGTYYIACATLAWDEALGKCVAGKVVSVTFTLEGTATGINSVDGTNNAIIKFIKDGKVMIKRGDSIFNTNGQQVK